LVDHVVANLRASGGESIHVVVGFQGGVVALELTRFGAMRAQSRLRRGLRAIGSGGLNAVRCHNLLIGFASARSIPAAYRQIAAPRCG
jgi:hypothetical protein